LRGKDEVEIFQTSKGELKLEAGFSELPRRGKTGEDGKWGQGKTAAVPYCE